MNGFLTLVCIVSLAMKPANSAVTAGNQTTQLAPSAIDGSKNIWPPLLCAALATVWRMMSECYAWMPPSIFNMVPVT